MENVSQRRRIHNRQSAIAAFVKKLNINKRKILEIGPGGHPLIRGCDTMDVESGFRPTILYDATRVPWPIRKHYSLVIALQVFEHFKNRQRKVFLEIKKRSDHAIISVPYHWDTTGSDFLIPSHCGIGEKMIRFWTHYESAVLDELIDPGGGSGLIAVRGFCFINECPCIFRKVKF